MDEAGQRKRLERAVDLTLKNSGFEINPDEIPEEFLPENLTPEKLKKIIEVYKFTKIEAGVLPFIFRYRTDKAIAKAMGISEQSIGGRLHTLYTKVRVGDKLALLAKLTGQAPILELDPQEKFEIEKRKNSEKLDT